jgi:hypothetical protein
MAEKIAANETIESKKAAKKARSSRNKALFLSGIYTASQVLGLGACKTGTSPMPEPERCDCPDGTEHNVACACGKDGCECKIKLSYNLTFGNRKVVLNVPDAGIEQEHLDLIQGVLDNAAIVSEAGSSAPLFASASEDIVITVTNDSGSYSYVSPNEIKISIEGISGFEASFVEFYNKAQEDYFLQLESHGHTFGGRGVVIAGGLTEDQVNKIKSMLDDLASSSDPAVQWLKEQTDGDNNTLTVKIGSGYACTATTLTITANFASDDSFNASVLAAVVDGAPEFCRCPNETVHEFSDSTCCTAGDCTCTIKPTHNLTFGTRQVILDVPASGITQAQKETFQTKLTTAFDTFSADVSNTSDPYLVAFLARSSIPLTISVVEESFSAPYFRDEGIDSLSIGQDFWDASSGQTIEVIFYTFSIMHNSEYISRMFDTSKETVRLAFRPLDIKRLTNGVMEQFYASGAQGVSVTFFLDKFLSI